MISLYLYYAALHTCPCCDSNFSSVNLKSFKPFFILYSVFIVIILFLASIIITWDKGKQKLNVVWAFLNLQTKIWTTTYINKTTLIYFGEFWTELSSWNWSLVSRLARIFTYPYYIFLKCRSYMEWTDDHDHPLCQEILALEPFKAKKGSIVRGQIWEKIASNLNSFKIPRFKVNKRSVREHYTLLIEKLKKKLQEAKKASGIETDMSDVEKALEEILEKGGWCWKQSGSWKEKKRIVPKLSRCGIEQWRPCVQYRKGRIVMKSRM